jgi:hypothetical protein
MGYLEIQEQHKLCYTCEVYNIHFKFKIPSHL